ncbi:MAG TPA: type II toxin-antitoxin system ParD family antitoxin [Acetobacteraceae bacterium]|nr:type II toxin-antitoxin system ParD family antitoxin [Acetobacteraceae bacterium]
MPSQHSLNVSLMEQLSGFIEDQVMSGRYRTSSEVVREALRLLERDLGNKASVRGARATLSKDFTARSIAP